ncbi:gamma-aminobutyric acid receptor subunit beta-like [Amblyomma americanum]
MDIDDISEENMAFRIHMFVVDLWRDDRLNLSRFLDDIASSGGAVSNGSGSGAGGPRRHASRVLPDEVRAALWKPDLIFVNSKNGYLFEHSVPNTFVKVLDTGHLYRSSRYLFQVDCLMELQKYPMDTQNCYLKVGLMSTPEDMATLHWMDDPGSPQRNFSAAIRLLEDIKPLQFDLKVPVAHSATEAWMFENYTYLYANFTFVRRLTASIVNTYIPSGLVVSLSWLTFWLDVSAVPARITLGVTSILTLATQVVQSRSSLPPVDYLKAVDVWLFVCLVMVFASLLEYAVAYNFEKILALERKRKTDSLPAAIRVAPSARITPQAWQSDGVTSAAPAAAFARPPSTAKQAETAAGSGNGDPCDGAANNHNHTLVTPSVVTLSVPNTVPNRTETTNNVTQSQGRSVKTGRRRIFQRSFTLSQLWQKTNLLDKVSRIAFPAVFFFFMLIYWSYYLW